MGKQALAAQNVFANHIKLQIDGIPFLQELQVGMRPGKRNDGNGEHGIGNIEGGQGNAVYTDAAFFNHQRGKLPGELKG